MKRHSLIQCFSPLLSPHTHTHPSPPMPFLMKDSDLEFCTAPANEDATRPPAHLSHRQQIESGQIDYCGRDSFEKIQAYIDDLMATTVSTDQKVSTQPQKPSTRRRSKKSSIRTSWHQKSKVSMPLKSAMSAKSAAQCGTDTSTSTASSFTATTATTATTLPSQKPGGMHPKASSTTTASTPQKTAATGGVPSTSGTSTAATGGVHSTSGTSTAPIGQQRTHTTSCSSAKTTISVRSIAKPSIGIVSSPRTLTSAAAVAEPSRVQKKVMVVSRPTPKPSIATAPAASTKTSRQTIVQPMTPSSSSVPISSSGSDSTTQKQMETTRVQASTSKHSSLSSAATASSSAPSATEPKATRGTLVPYDNDDDP